MKSWADVLLESVIDVGIARVKKIALSLMALQEVLRGLFPTPGPDATARVIIALLDVASAFQVLDAFVVEVAGKTLAEIQVPPTWKTRVIRLDTAAGVALLAMADGIYVAGRTFDTVAAEARTAVFIKKWRSTFFQTFRLVRGRYLDFVIKAFEAAIKFSPLRILSALLTTIDVVFKTTFGIVGFAIALKQLDTLQNGLARNLLSQAAPRRRARLRPKGSINRRIGGSPP